MSARLGQRSAAGNRQMARYGALLFGAATVVSALGLVFPHQAAGQRRGPHPRGDRRRARSRCMLAVGGDRLRSGRSSSPLASGTILIALSLVFNGERDGGAAGGDEVYFLWIALFAAYFFSRRVLALQTAFIAVGLRGCAATSIDPGPVAVSRWLTHGRPRGRLRGDRLHPVGAQQAARRRSRPGGAHRPAHRPGESPGVRGAARGGDRAVAIATAGRCRCCSATSTA